jgi:Protein of unknown function (DUF2934)
MRQHGIPADDLNPNRDLLGNPRSRFDEERERLLQSTREQEIRNRACEIYLQRGAQPGYEAQGEPHGGYRYV